MSKVVIFTGAGISAESGISTFRSKNGIWNQYDMNKVCKKGCLAKHREETLSFYDTLRQNLKDKLPNKAHKKLCELKNKFPKDIAIITQNVDDLFEKAGCKDVLYLHGFLKNIRCRKCNYKENIGYTKQDRDKRCPQCNSTLRPDVVFFGEKAPKYKDLQKELIDCKLLVIIGSSLKVLNPLVFAFNPIKSIICDIEDIKDIDKSIFSKIIIQPASKAIKEIEEEILKELIDV
jgi:NAD-dependent deacetylase